MPGDALRRVGSVAEVVVQGILRQANQRPLRLGVVSVLEPNGRQIDWARTDNDGRWSIVLPETGEYLVIYSVERWTPRSELRHLGTDEPNILELEDRLMVAGVVSAGGWPVDNALVVLSAVSGESVGATRTDEDGYYQMAMPPVGRYLLTALDPTRGAADSTEVIISAQGRQFNVVMPDPAESCDRV